MKLYEVFCFCQVRENCSYHCWFVYKLQSAHRMERIVKYCVAYCHYIGRGSEIQEVSDKTVPRVPSYLLS